MTKFAVNQLRLSVRRYANQINAIPACNYAEAAGTRPLITVSLIMKLISSRLALHQTQRRTSSVQMRAGSPANLHRMTLSKDTFLVKSVRSASDAIVQ